MSLLYNVAIHVYAAGVRLAAIKHRKAALMVQGHRETLARIAEVRRNVAPEGFDVWIHAASLGEFEQARPLISMIRRQQPHKSILLSFSRLRGILCDTPIRMWTWWYICL